MVKNTTENLPFSFFYIGEHAIIGTPEGIAESERTIDTNLTVLTEDIKLQDSLRLVSRQLERKNRTPDDLQEMTAFLLTSFINDGHELAREEYLLGQKPIRILRLDDVNVVSVA